MGTPASSVIDVVGIAPVDDMSTVTKEMGTLVASIDVMGTETGFSVCGVGTGAGEVSTPVVGIVDKAGTPADDIGTGAE